MPIDLVTSHPPLGPYLSVGQALFSKLRISDARCSGGLPMSLAAGPQSNTKSPPRFREGLFYL